MYMTENEANEAPATVEGKLDKVIKLLTSLLDPMACTLKEIKASNRSRRIVVLSMIIIAVAMLYSVYKITVLTDRMTKIQADAALYGNQTNKLLDLAITTASTPETVEKLKDIKASGDPTPENIVSAVKAQLKRSGINIDGSAWGDGR